MPETITPTTPLPTGTPNGVAFDRVERAFNAIMARRAGGSEASITAVCEGDPALAAEVRSLLDFATDADGVDAPTKAPFLDPAELFAERAHRDETGVLEEWGASAVGQRIGDFTLIAPVGMGGMGVVFVAEQERPQRKVALKLIRRTAATAQMVRRFEREAQLLGRLNHPGIAQIYAAGVAELAGQSGLTPVRVPYLAMELIEGPSILDYVCHPANEPDTSRRLALQLIAQSCDAVHHAHQRGVIHRDLKPANVLVCHAPDGAPQAKVLDFGVARPAGGTDDAMRAPTEAITVDGYLVGTLAYMSPEQLQGGDTVDVRSDVYAMGVMLYQLLCCRLPLSVDGCALPEAARRIAHDQPERAAAVNKALRGDVDTIVTKALEKEPARRYQSCAELARDIRHQLAGEPIEARRDSVAYLLRRRVAAYRRLAWSAVLLLTLAAAFAVYAVRQQRVQKEVAATATAARADADAAAAGLANELSASHIEQGHLLGEAGELTSAERLLWDEYFAASRREQAEWGLRELYARNGCLRTFRAQGGECRTVAMTLGGRRFVTGGTGPDVHVWATETGQHVAAYDTGFGNTRAVAATSDGRYVVAGGDRGACVIDTTTGVRRPVVTGGGDVWGVAVAPDDTAVALGNRAGVVRLFDPATGHMRLELGRARVGDDPHAPTAAVHDVAFDPTGDHLAAVYDDGAVRVWTLAGRGDALTATPGAYFAGHADGTTVCGVAFNPFGTLLATGGNDRKLKLWRVADGTELASCETNNGTARTIDFTPDGRQVAVSGLWRTQVMDVAAALRDGTAAMTPLGDDDGSYAAAFTPDGRRLVTAYTSGACRVWDRTADATVFLPGRDARVCGLGVASFDNACVIASAQENGDLIVRTCPRADTRKPSAWTVRTHTNVGDGARCLALTPDGRTMLVGYGDGRVRAVSATDGRVEQELAGPQNAIDTLALSNDGRIVVAGGADGRACVWARSGTAGEWEPRREFNCGGGVVGVAIDPTQRLLATTATDRSLRFWSIGRGRLLGQWAESRTPWRLAFSADGRRLATGSWDRSIRVWDVDGPDLGSKRPLSSLRLTGHTQLVTGQAFDPTGRFLASSSDDGTLRLWDVSSAADFTAVQADDRRRCLATFDAHAGDALALAFLPATGVAVPPVAVGYADGSVRLWRPPAYDGNLVGQTDYQHDLRLPQKAKATGPALERKHANP